MSSEEGFARPSDPVRERPGAPLGTLVFRAGLVPADQLEDALAESARRGRRLGEILLERGLVEEQDLARIIAGQQGLPFLSGEELEPEPNVARLLPEEKARLYRALVVRVDAGVPLVAITDPTNELVLREITAALGTEARFAVASRRDLLEALTVAYGAASPNGDFDERGLPLPSPASRPGLPPARAEDVPAPPPLPPRPARGSGHGYVVVVRLANGERVEVAESGDRTGAEERARNFIRSLAGREPGDWPLVGGRFLRPDAIVSVDVVDRGPAGAGDRRR